MTAKLFIDPRELARFTRAMAQLPPRVGFLQLRKAMSAWGGIVKAEAVAQVPQDTKLLKKSLAVGKPIIPDSSWDVRHHGKPAKLFVGPRRRFVAVTQFRQLKSGRLKASQRIVKLRHGQKLATTAKRASRYAHLAEMRKPFIGPAQRAGNTRGLAKFKQKLGQGIEEEARKLAARQAARIR